MASAYYPLGMSSYNNTTNQGGYKTWKGTGLFGNPIGITSGNIRPQTNKDPRNVAIYKQGLPRPIKHYRRGKGMPIPNIIANNSNIKEEKYETIEANYYSDREVKTSISNKIIGQLVDRPGAFIVKDNSLENFSTINNPDPYIDNNKVNTNTNTINNDCKKCDGVGLISSWMPINNLTENPQPNTQNKLLCCNAQRKAITRVLPTSSNLTDNYYSNVGQYLYKRCQTYDQRAFNFITSVANKQIYDNLLSGKPVLNGLITNGDAPAYKNMYVANCNPTVNISNDIDISIIDRVASILFSKLIITNEEYILYVSEKIKSVNDFILFLNSSISLKNKNNALEVAYQIFNHSKININMNMNMNNVVSSTNSTNNGCKIVAYKPNNPQFAQQGAVKSSTQILKLNASTISANILNTQRTFGAGSLCYGIINVGGQPDTPFIYKGKIQECVV